MACLHRATSTHIGLHSHWPAFSCWLQAVDKGGLSLYRKPLPRLIFTAYLLVVHLTLVALMV